MVSDDEIRALAKLTLRHKVLLELSFDIIDDLAELMIPQLKTCSCDCKEPATVRHIDADIIACDAHAAQAIVRARSGLEDPRLADEEHWIDVPHARRVRRLKEYVDFLRKNDELVPSARAELH